MNPEIFCDRLVSNGSNFICGVPDSLLKNLINLFNQKFDNHIITANEGNAIAMVAGHYIASKQIGVVYIQNSGLGNCINPILSLTDEDVYNIPFLMIIGYRGEPNIKDEPQHYKQGLLTLPLLDCINIKYKIFEDITDIDNAYEYIKKEGKPFALVIKKDTFEVTSINKEESSNVLSREDAIIKIASKSDKQDIFVSTTGMISRELYEYRKNNNMPLQDFLMVGAMGHASSFAYAIAMEKKDRRVYILDGDGACLMHMGSLPVLASLGIDNIIHILLNNSAHDSVGGQPTIGDKINFSEIAKNCGYKQSYQVSTIEELDKALDNINGKSCFIEVKVKKGNRKDLGRPKETPIENKKMFMEFLDNE